MAGGTTAGFFFEEGQMKYDNKTRAALLKQAWDAFDEFIADPDEDTPERIEAVRRRHKEVTEEEWTRLHANLHFAMYLAMGGEVH